MKKVNNLKNEYATNKVNKDTKITNTNLKNHIKKNHGKRKIGNSKILIYIAAIFIGYIITINFNFNGINKFMNMDSKQYQSIQSEKNKLNRQINALEKENLELNNKIKSYSTSGNKSEKIVADMKAQNEYYGMISGNNEIKGPGVKITINDGIVSDDDTTFDKLNKLLHDKDMRNLINAVRVAGAEAITINNQRITIHSSVQCNGSFLLFDDGKVEVAPFNIYIIGDPESLKTNLMKESGYLKLLKSRGLRIEIESSEEIKMPAADVRSISYCKEYIHNSDD